MCVATDCVFVYLKLQNFEAAVQANVLVNGRPWEEAPDDEGDPSPFSYSCFNYYILRKALFSQLCCLFLYHQHPQQRMKL